MYWTLNRSMHASFRFLKQGFRKFDSLSLRPCRVQFPNQMIIQQYWEGLGRREVRSNQFLHNTSRLPSTHFPWICIIFEMNSRPKSMNHEASAPTASKKRSLAVSWIPHWKIGKRRSPTFGRRHMRLPKMRYTWTNIIGYITSNNWP
jgi:hypothetical protein